MSILSGPEIRRRVAAGDIEIDPFVDAHVNPASVDLTLGTMVRMYQGLENNKRQLEVHDVHEPGRTTLLDITSRGFDLWPGYLYLMHTAERVHTKKFVPVLDGKSSIARLGVQVHLTAGFGDVGFDGQYTLEVVTFRAVRLYPGMRICQMRFHEVVGEIELYEKTGHYVGAAARGPVPSMVHKQFEKKPDVLTPGERAYIEETIRNLGVK